MLRILLVLSLLMSSPLLARDGPEAGDVAPNRLGTESRSGEKLRVDAHRGKVLVVSFWASWCGPCLEELPILEGLQHQVSPDQLRVVAINFKESTSLYRQHLGKMKDMKMTLVHDRNGSLSDAYGVDSLPNMFIIDHEGRVAHVHHGYSKAMLPTIVDEVNALLKARAAAISATASRG